jgi:hypothetical protein
MADALQRIPITICLSKVALAAGSTSTISNTGTIVFGTRGKAYSKAAMTNATVPTTDWATGNAAVSVAPGFGTVLMFGLTAAATPLLKWIQGTVVPLDGSAAFINAPTFGALGPSGSGTNSGDFCAIGYVLVTNNLTTGSAWVYPASWTATGIVTTFVDVIGEPDRPQTS